MTTRRAYVALGSNLGDRGGALALARRRLAALPGTTLAAVSAVEETAPLGDLPQPAYLNQMVALDTALSPEQLFDGLLAIEREAGRERSGRWAPRTLDLDIVLFEGGERHDAGLTIPHPGLPDRGFWQRELQELGASW